jgi:hypothetical protein
MYTRLHTLGVHKNRFVPIKLGAAYLNKNKKWLRKNFCIDNKRGKGRKKTVGNPLLFKAGLLKVYM